MNTVFTYYDILGISEISTLEEIKYSYRKLSSQYHPDRNKKTDAVKKMQEINQAYSVLSDDLKRQDYDLQLKIWRESQGQGHKDKSQNHYREESVKKEESTKERAGKNQDRQERQENVEPEKEKSTKSTKNTKSSEELEENYYRILGVLQNATDREIRLAYSSRLNEYIVLQDSAGRDELLQQLTKAYEVLSSPRGRKKYDRKLEAFHKRMVRRNRVIKLPTYYDLLRVPSDASELQIRKAYGKLAQEILEIDNSRVRKNELKKANKVFNILCDKELRAKYDSNLENKINHMRLSRIERVGSYFDSDNGVEIAAILSLVLVLVIIATIMTVFSP